MKIVSLAEAKKQGLKHYYTGFPCVRGHLSVRYVSGKGCADCARLRTNKWRQENPDHKKQYHAKNRQAAKYSRMLRIYGLDQNQFELMLKEQNDSCNICKEPFEKTPHIDHCHITGVVRGLLCFHCNSVLGHAKDNPDILRAAIAYLEEKLVQK